MKQLATRMSQLAGVIAVATALPACPDFTKSESTADSGPVTRVCTLRTDCSTGEVCAAGVCIPGECETRADCAHPADQLCNEMFECIPDPKSPIGNQCPAGDQDCGLGQFCSAGTCYDTTDRVACQRPSQCTGDERCDTRAGFCVPNKGGCDRCTEYPELCCIANEEACDPETKRCRPISGARCTVATVADDCLPGQRCVDGRCVQCTADTDCGPGTVCNTATGTCVSDATCQNDEDCVRFPGRRCALSTHQCTVPQCTSDASCRSTDSRNRCNMETFMCYLPPAVCATDADEPNDTTSQATALTPKTTGSGFSGSGTLCRGNTDYATFPILANKRVAVTVTLTPGSSGEASGVVAELYIPGASGAAQTATFSYSASKKLQANITDAGDVFVKLVGNGAEEDHWGWALDVEVTEPLSCDTEAGEPNNTPAQASNSVVTGPSFSRMLCSATDVDYHLFHAAGNKVVTFSVEFDDTASVDVALLTASGTELSNPYDHTSPVVVSTRTTSGAQDLVLRLEDATYYPTGDPVVYTVTITETDVPTCNDQAMEPNNSKDQAFLITPGTIQGVSCEYSDDDWYRITLSRASPVDIAVSFTSGTDLDIYLYDAAGNTVDQSSATSNPETIEQANLAAGTYYLKIHPYTSSSSSSYPIPYTITFTAPGFCEDDTLDTGSGNDSAATATPIRDWVTSPLEYSKDLNICRGDEDWFRLLALGSERIAALVTGAEGLTVVVYGSGASGLQELGRSHHVTLASGTAGEFVSVPVNVEAGLFYVKIMGGVSTEGAYHLTLSTPADPCEGLSGDAESNDAPANALSVVVDGPNSGIMCPVDDQDLWKVQLGAGALLTATVEFDGSKGDIDLQVWQPAQPQPSVEDSAVNTAAGAQARVEYTAPSAGTYFLVVRRKPGGELGQAYTLRTTVVGGVTPSSSSGAGASSSSSGPGASSAASSGSNGSSSAEVSSSSAAVSTTSSGEAPSSSAEAPSSSAEAPSSSAEAPSSSAEAPSSSAEAPSSSAEAPSSSVEVSSSSSAGTTSSSGPVQPPTELCTGGVDEDSDTFTDCADQSCFVDAACMDAMDPEICDDGTDNDGDGYTDCADSECITDVVYCRLGEDCATPGDEDGDGVADCDDPECRGVPGSTCP